MPGQKDIERLRELLGVGAGRLVATSSGEDLPRDVGFLFSRNRLNVAISRARCLAVLFANPRLLEVSCRTIEQMRLVNTLCWAKTYSDALKHPSRTSVLAPSSPIRGPRSAGLRSPFLESR